VNHFSDNLSREGRIFRRFQHHRRPCGKGRQNLGHDSDGRPVPRSDQTADTDRRQAHQGIAVQFIEFVCLECLESNPGVAQRPSDVGMARRPFRRAHLLRHRRTQVVGTRFETGDNPLQQGNPFFPQAA